MRVISSEDPMRPNSKGVAFLLNKRLVRWKEATTKEIFPGRALLLTLPWVEQPEAVSLHILAIYAPNDDQESKRFWEALNSMKRCGTLPDIDIMLGDFNIIEEAMDRLPSHPDNENAVEALQDLKSQLRIQDAWRQTYPSTINYTYFHKGTLRQSRLDRIYMKRKWTKLTTEWRIDTAPFENDHKLVSKKILNPKAPDIGKGRWAIPPFVTENREFIDKVKPRDTTNIHSL
ncbi:hypothetical protein M422DRAFT_267982 [Sphaerobolus stellatus SS14]|uniref:Endonuclease/exonuclease/phosphatase domain-containing protein n=1 Tax=Sphaerobolus stellatus (strain SS14) TaxID=990650 RepID=A0A0C9TL41_SPHS4|nr:hypothetical protein M422DRAFT_267982 [Sphaerobolus stellatus SS14]